MTNEWRRVIAALANPGRRAVWAAAVLATTAEPTGAKRAQAVEALRDAGLLDADGTPVTVVFSDLLASEPEVRREGIQRFIRKGRIEQYPSKPALRLELLDWVAGTLPRHLRMTERELGGHLAVLVDDVVTLRRYLVDAGALSRTPDGSVYEVVRPEPSASSTMPADR